MRNKCAFLLFLLLLFGLFACEKDQELLESETTQTTTTQTTFSPPEPSTIWVVTTVGETHPDPQTFPENLMVYEGDDVEGAWELPYYPTKRAAYYQLIDYAMEIVGYDRTEEFIQDYYANHYLKGVEPSEMYLKRFVQYFDIPKDVLAAAIERKAEFFYQGGDEYNTTEENEFPNLDILYTFDDEIINAYYERVPTETTSDSEQEVQ